MTIPEAVSLVLQAGAYARGERNLCAGNGRACEGDDMAKFNPSCQGYTPDVDIKIEYTRSSSGRKTMRGASYGIEEGMKNC